MLTMEVYVSFATFISVAVNGVFASGDCTVGVGNGKSHHSIEDPNLDNLSQLQCVEMESQLLYPSLIQ